MSECWFVYIVLLKHYTAKKINFLLKLCKFEYGWGKL